MSYLNESPRGSVNTQSFITMFMYLQNKNGNSMFRDVTKSSGRALIISELNCWHIRGKNLGTSLVLSIFYMRSIIKNRFLNTTTS